MDRRKFIKATAINTAAIAAGPLFLKRSLLTTAAASQPSVLAVSEGKDYAKLVKDILEPLGGISQFVKPGFNVVIKPNMGWNRTPEMAANTHPEVIKALVKLALDAGARKVSIFDRTCNEERLCYTNSGIKQAVESLKDGKVDCYYIDERRFVDVAIPKGKSIKSWSFYKDAVDADCYINVPVAKHHGLTELSLGLKNVMGIIGNNRGKIHHGIDRNLADLHTAFHPTLTIIDATRMLLRHGPQGGNSNDVQVQNMLIASTDIVAADAYASTLFGMKSDHLSTTQAAYRAGLGEMNLEKMKIVRV